jgi:transglutaminase-like putative cysteine protease
MFSRYRIALSFVLVATIALAPASAQDAFTRLEPTAKQVEASLRTDWYGVYLKGEKIGYFKADRQRTDKGIAETVDLRMKIQSFNQKVEMGIGQRLLYEGKAPYALLEGEFTESAGPVATRIHLTRQPSGEFSVVQTVGKNVRKKTVNALDYTLADALTPELWIQRGPAVGETLKSREVELKDQKIESQKNTIVAVKNSLVEGVELKFYEVETISSHEKIKVLSRYDAKGNMLSGHIAVFELRKETEEQAKDTKYSKDLFVMGMAKVERPLGDLKKVQELVLDVDGAADAFADGPRQSVTKNGSKVQLRLGKRHGVPVKATADEVKENLRETSSYDLTDPKIKTLAAQAAGNAKSDEEKVKNIAKFVHDYIEPKLGNNLPTIHDLVERKQGDCKSYALLFCTLARANGVPAREVAGLVYAGDDTKAFGGHAWNEVILNGVWVPIDASLNETEVNATHLSFGADKTAAKNMLETLGTLKLRVVEMKAK